MKFTNRLCLNVFLVEILNHKYSLTIVVIKFILLCENDNRKRIDIHPPPIDVLGLHKNCNAFCLYHTP